MKGKLIKVSNKFSILALLLIISCNANMNTNDKNKVLNEHNLKNISEVIKNSLQIESDLKKEPEANKNQSTPPILEIEKIEPGTQEFSLKSESESSIPLEILEGANVVKSEEEIAKIQEKLLLIGASDERIAQELDPNIQKSLNPTTIEFKILSTADEKTILDPTEEEINTNGKDKIFDQKKENSTLSETTKTPIQNQFQKHGISLSKDGNFITKEYVEQVRESLDKALNAIKSLEKSKDLFNLDAEENLLKDLGNSQNKTNSSISNNINAENIEKQKYIPWRARKKWA